MKIAHSNFSTIGQIPHFQPSVGCDHLLENDVRCRFVTEESTQKSDKDQISQQVRNYVMIKPEQKRNSNFRKMVLAILLDVKQPRSRFCDSHRV